jgi:intermembrane space import and assembly protein 40
MGEIDVVQPLPETTEENEQLLTIEALAQERQQRKASVAATEKHTASPPSPSSGAQETHAAGGVQDLQEEADQQGAFNPETGEINWDCPCLGGMAHGPCGEEFRAAFSCFVYSTEEPKGMDCIEKFKCVLQYQHAACDKLTNAIGACRVASANIPKSTVLS